MTRFDKALERARAAPKGRNGLSDGFLLPEEAPAAELFEAPWRVRDAGMPAAGFPVAAPEPAAREGPVLVRRHPAFSEKIVTDAGVSAAVVEQYRRLAGALHRWQLERGAKVVMVVSTLPGEGRTLTAVNLALSLRSSHGRRVLLVDGHLRRPMLHRVLQVAGEPGIAEIAATGVPVAPTAVAARLALVPAGTLSDIAAPLASAGVAMLLQQCRADYDWIVIDTPPAAEVQNRGLLGVPADGVVLVVGSGRARRDVVRQTLAHVGIDRVLGVVLNQVEAHDMSAAENYRFRAQR